MKGYQNLAVSVVSLLVCALAPAGFAYAQQVSVTAADPSAAEQGTISLDVAVSGSGFNSSASVKFLVTGTTDTGGITVKKVVVNSAKKLTATIDVAETAVVNKFDIEVALSNGRKGKGTTLFTVQAKGTGKPTLPPPPPLPPNQTCAGAPGAFPAFAYVKNRYVTVKKGGGTQAFNGSDIHITNSTASCSIVIYQGTKDSSPGDLVYRQNGTEGRIVWTQGTDIRLLKFNVVNGTVVEPLPLTSSTVYVLNYTSPSSIQGMDLSRDGKTVYYPDESRTVDFRWLDTINMVDISTCTANCTSQRVYTFPVDVGAGGLEINDSDDRIYLAIHDRVPDIRTVSFLEKQGSTWASPLLRHVISDQQDTAYATVRGLANVAIGKWDYNNNSVPRDVLTYVVEHTTGPDTIDIIDVTNCLGSGVTSCLSSGEGSVIRTGIPRSSAAFMYPPVGGPKLLTMGGGWISEVDLDSLTITTLVEGAGGVDSAD
jgi:hypothetical protein